MHAAIKCIEDTLLIRRLQARELGYDSDKDRQSAIMEDIASLERGLRLLVNEEQRTKNEERTGSPTIGDPGQNRQEAV